MTVTYNLHMLNSARTACNCTARKPFLPFLRWQELLQSPPAGISTFAHG